MYDVRNLIFPMTAGDLVQSAVVVGLYESSGGLPLRLEVLSIKPIIHEKQVLPNKLEISFLEQVTQERFEVTLNADTPLLVTSISRS